MKEFYNLLEKNKVFEQSPLEVLEYLINNKYTKVIFGAGNYTTKSKDFKFVIFIKNKSRIIGAIHVHTDFPQKASLLFNSAPIEAFNETNGWIEYDENLKNCVSKCVS
jgi:hypothetical protein